MTTQMKAVKGMYKRTKKMIESNAKAQDAMLQTITDRYGAEIDALLRAHDKDYEQRVYIKPIYWMDDLKDHPENYPKLVALDVLLQKRYISLFLKWQGRIARGTESNPKHLYSRTNVWMLPNAAEVQA